MITWHHINLALHAVAALILIGFVVAIIRQILRIRRGR